MSYLHDLDMNRGIEVYKSPSDRLQPPLHNGACRGIKIIKAEVGV